MNISYRNGLKKINHLNMDTDIWPYRHMDKDGDDVEKLFDTSNSDNKVIGLMKGW